MSIYLAITIGPIYKTITQARSTRELWASSYLFSVVMREIIYAANDGYQLISPEKLPLTAHCHGAGIYPDRSFWKLNDLKESEKLQQIIQDAFTRIEEKLGLRKKYLLNYIRLYAVTFDLTGDTSPILKLNELLDSLELQEKIADHKPDIISEFVDNIQKLYDDGHQNINERSIFISYQCDRWLRRLPSIIELATSDLQHKLSKSNTAYFGLVIDPMSNNVCELIRKNKKRVEYNKDEQALQDNLIKTLKKEYADHFRFRHKYIAFIKADGDRMGETLGKIGNQEAGINAFSKYLAAFASKAAKLITDFGGLPIFIGGDDLLFTLPIVNSNLETTDASGRNIFELICKIDAAFPKKDFANLINNQFEPSLSYGISISYYKYPMGEALEACEETIRKAKDFPGKNAVCFELRKHSGQTITTTFSKSKAFEEFSLLLADFDSFNDEAFLSSVMYKLIQLQPLLSDALINNRMEYFFKNQFNEKDHQDRYNTYLKSVRVFADKLFAENNQLMNDSKESAEHTVQGLYACLRFVQFINQKDHD